MNDIEIFISGDFCPIRGAEKKLGTGLNPEKVFDGLKDVIEKADISITNLECPLTKKNHPIEKIGSKFRSDPEIAKFLNDSEFDLITLANNHIYDQGEKGLKDTINSLERNDLDFVGAGMTLEEAQTPHFIDIKGVKLAFLNFAEVEFSCANENHGGANPMDLIDNVQQIKSAKKKADRVILIIHGGHEHHHYPSPETMKRYRFFAEMGADAIIGHHTHCISGYEVYENVPIFYSLGNFFFPGTKKHNKSYFEGFAINLKISENDINFDIFPYEQCKNDKYNIELKSKKSDIYEKIEKISSRLDDEEFIKSKFDDYIEGKKEEVFLARMAGYNRYTIYAFRRLGLFKILKFFISKKDMMFIKQMITCQAHRETSKNILKKYLKY